MAQYTNLKNALEFNKVTVALAVAGIAAGVEAGSRVTPIWSKAVFTASTLLLFISLIEGLMVFGRASRLKDTDDYSAPLASIGRSHLVLLGLGWIPIAAAAFIKIWI